MTKRKDDVAERASRATMVGAVVAAFAASACCLLPALLAFVGLSGVGLAAAIEPYRPLLLGVTGGLLVVGFYLLYVRPARATATATEAGMDACGCEALKTRRAGRGALWVATAAALLFAAYPYISAANAKTQAHGDAADIAEPKTVTIGVTGMSCESCAATLTEALAAVPGVARARVSFDDSSADVSYDPARVSPADLAKAINGIEGYEAKVRQP